MSNHHQGTSRLWRVTHIVEVAGFRAHQINVVSADDRDQASAVYADTVSVERVVNQSRLA